MSGPYPSDHVCVDPKIWIRLGELMMEKVIGTLADATIWVFAGVCMGLAALLAIHVLGQII